MISTTVESFHNLLVSSSTHETDNYISANACQGVSNGIDEVNVVLVFLSFESMKSLVCNLFLVASY